MSKIIDFSKKGNVVRFYLGNDTDSDYWGDDWNDTPYEHNAGEVYSEYITGHVDVAFPFDWLVSEPSEDWHFGGNSPYCKEDFKNRKAPCIIAIPYNVWHLDEYTWDDGCFSEWVGADNIYKFYFGDKLETLINFEGSKNSMESLPYIISKSVKS